MQSRQTMDVLDAAGFSVSHAPNGAQALKLLQSSEPDLILSDAVMPVMDGFDLARAVKQNKRWQHIPFVLLTILDDTDDLIRSLKSGADHFVRKPCAHADLVARLRHILHPERVGPNDTESWMTHPPDIGKLDVPPQRLFNLLISTYQQAVHINQELKAREASVRDLNRRLMQRSAMLEAANLELEGFAHSLTHDLKQPLEVMSGHLTQLEKYWQHAPVEARQALEALGIQSERMEVLVNNLLELSRAAHARLNIERIDLSGMIRQIISRLLPDSMAAHAMIRIDPDIIVTADQRACTVMLENLVRNAIQFASPGTPLELDVHCRMSGNEVEFWIEDNGVGFDARMADRLFEPFQNLRTHGNTHLGPGIGLATVKRLVDRHEGRIWAVSHPGEGSSFHIALPVRPLTPSMR
ncbi:hybrid sensor histidine kinase/response regulator [Burkholderiaceae bacterium DAT-1]|nr:hybrid sensor histidine kinase/response regulator [Burkholderiaceae bacterium DAT-1]